MTLLSDDEVRLLGAGGLVVRDDFLGPELARAVAKALQDVPLKPAGVGRGAERHVDPLVRGDATGWVARLDTEPIASLFGAFDALQDALNTAAYEGLDHYDVQLARYPGDGSGYAKHRDAFAGPRSRRVTAILYLNEGWRPEHGGCLRADVPGGAVDVEPRLDRAVIFLSERVEHEVLPAHAPRVAVTAWYYGRDAL